MIFILGGRATTRVPATHSARDPGKPNDATTVADAVVRFSAIYCNRHTKIFAKYQGEYENP